MANKEPAAKIVASKKAVPVKTVAVRPGAKSISNKTLQKPVHARLSANPEKRIRERIKQHPNAMVTEIVASLEMDGVAVTSDQVQQVMNQLRSPPA